MNSQNERESGPMSKPWIHALASVKRYGGIPNDYIEIHTLLDASKKACSDNRHRVLTHTTWFTKEIIPRIFGQVMKNSEGREFSPEQVAEDHINEDYGMRFIPTVMDFIQEMEFKPWMQNSEQGECPSSVKKLSAYRNSKKKQVDWQFDNNETVDGVRRPIQDVTFDGK